MLRTRLLIGSIMIAGLYLTLQVDDYLGPWYRYPCWFVLGGAILMTAALELVDLLGATRPPPLLQLRCCRHPGDPHLELGPPRRSAQWSFRTHAGFRVRPRRPHGRPRLAVPRLRHDHHGHLHRRQPPVHRPHGDTMGRIATTILAIGYPGILGTFILQMRWFEGHLQGILSLAFLVATGKGADVRRLHLRSPLRPSQTLARLEPTKNRRGRRGRPRLRPRRGPHRRLDRPQISRGPHSDWPHAIVYGLVIGTFAQLGDLMESMIKRDCARKDASAAVPGFGGVLDVLDFPPLRRPRSLRPLALLRPVIQRSDGRHREHSATKINAKSTYERSPPLQRASESRFFDRRRRLQSPNLQKAYPSASSCIQ